MKQNIKYVGSVVLIALVYQISNSILYASIYIHTLDASVYRHVVITNTIVPAVSSLLLSFLFFFIWNLVKKNRIHLVWAALIFVGVHLIIRYSGTVIDYSQDSVIISIGYMNHLLNAAFFGLLYYFVYDNLVKTQRTKELEKQNLQSELALLKNQLNPHFLFNTLNNIDSLIRKDTDQASHALVEMSGMMRYMIYETDTMRVPLTKELEYVSQYIDLQKMQYGNAELVDFSITGNADEWQVAPMLFIPFVENAFKHTTGKELPGAIRIMFIIIGSEILLRVENTADNDTAITKDASSGIGLDTVQRRLELLYPNRYKLVISNQNALFCVSLTINLDD